MKKRKFHFKMKKTLWLISLNVLLVFFLAILCLDNYLYQIQREERLSKVENYNDFTMTFHEENRCQNHQIMNINNQKLIYNCIEQIYIHYGSVTIFLNYALENNYITLDDILSHTIKIDNKENKDIKVYLYENKKTNSSFTISISEEEIIFKPVKS